MTKLFLILLIGLVFESTGIVFLKKGMTQIGDMSAVNAGEVFRMVKAGVPDDPRSCGESCGTSRRTKSSERGGPMDG